MSFTRFFVIWRSSPPLPSYSKVLTQHPDLLWMRLITPTTDPEKVERDVAWGGRNEKFSEILLVGASLMRITPKHLKKNRICGAVATFLFPTKTFTNFEWLTDYTSLSTLLHLLYPQTNFKIPFICNLTILRKVLVKSSAVLFILLRYLCFFCDLSK